jgi:hypothetical protein
MSRISRDTFASTLAPGLDISTLDKKTEAALEKAGLDKTTLNQLAGTDGVISEKTELDELFDLIDQSDRNGSRRSLDTTRPGADGKEELTASGELYEALEGAVERARIGRRGAGSGARPDNTPAEGRIATDSPAKALPEARYRASASDLNKAHTTLKALGFSEIHIAPNTPYFNQAQGDWAKHAYPKSPPQPGIDRTLKDAGCAPSALAMADAALRGTGTLPPDVADFSVAHKYSGTPTGHGSDSHGLGKAWAKKHGLVYTPARHEERAKNVDVLREGLKQGGVGIVSVGVDAATGKGHFTAKGHVMLINGYAKDRDGKEWFFVVNPGRRDQTKGRVLTVDENVVQNAELHHGAGQLRISRSQLLAEMKHGFVLSRKE